MSERPFGRRRWKPAHVLDLKNVVLDKKHRLFQNPNAHTVLLFTAWHPNQVKQWQLEVNQQNLLARRRSKHSQCFFFPRRGKKMWWKFMYSPFRGKVMLSFYVFFFANLNKMLNKQSSCPWFKMEWHSYDVAAMIVAVLTPNRMHQNAPNESLCFKIFLGIPPCKIFSFFFIAIHSHACMMFDIILNLLIKNHIYLK